MLKVDVHGRYTELSQCVLETLRHPTGTAHVDIPGDDGTTTAGLYDVFHGEGPVALGVDDVRPEGWVLCGRRTDLVEKQRLVFATHRVVQVDVELHRLLCGERTYPASKRSDADAASDPHLLTGTLAVIEQTKGNTHDGRCPRLEGVREVLGVIAQGLDRETKIAFLRGTADAEGVPFPLGAPTEVHENELPCYKLQGPGRRSKYDLERSRVQMIDRLHRIVVLPPPRKKADKQLPVHVCCRPDHRHCHVPPQQDRRAPQDGVLQ